MTLPATTAPGPHLAAPVSAETLDLLKAALGPGSWSDDPDKVESRLTEWRGRWRGETPLLALPDSVEAVSRLVKLCAQHGVAITPQGGNTGLVGGQIPHGRFWSRPRALDRVRIEDLARGRLHGGRGGVTLLEAQEAAESAGRCSRCRWRRGHGDGGRQHLHQRGRQPAVLRYGDDARPGARGCRRCWPNGDGGPTRSSALRKDNTGYDLKQLLIEAEGTLGHHHRRQPEVVPADAFARDGVRGLLARESGQRGHRALMRAKEETGNGVEAFELMGRLGHRLRAEEHRHARTDEQRRHAWYALIEIVSSEPNGAEAGLERAGSGVRGRPGGRRRHCAERAADERLPGVSARISPRARSRAGGDGGLGVPFSRIADFIAEASDAVMKFHPGSRLVIFGHVGDGNIHFDVIQPAGGDGAAFAALRDQGARVVHDIVALCDGSISAEHGCRPDEVGRGAAL